jgi:hypothetical protein
MKTTQAWGWLVAGVLAAGMNASYHQGGLQWAHQIADQVEHNSAAVLALASGRADQFLSEARYVTAQNETTSCRLGTVLARVQTGLARRESGFARGEAMSARQEAQLARWEANRARMEARIEAQTAHFRFDTASFAPAAIRVIQPPVVCPRVRVNIPQLPMMKIPAVPVIHIQTAAAGPV